MKITDMQTAALTAAAARPDGAILPLPAHIRGGAIGKGSIVDRPPSLLVEMELRGLSPRAVALMAPEPGSVE